MKKKNLNWGVVLFFSLLPIALFSACDKDTNCYLDVQVYNGATEIPFSNTKVEIYQSVCDPSDHNYRLGMSDMQGQYKTSFTAPAILKIKVTYMLDTIRPDLYQGYRTSEVAKRIIEGETTTATVHVASDTLWMQLQEPAAI
ncbi:MAG: hypothetical protein K6F72_07355 [Bacteroidales bacterium]|nr:hypothetical protein [Bacteroidales bacterium]